MRRMPSSSMRLPCSTDATPARTARLIASAPCAWAATFFPHIAASCTTALSSSCEYCGAPTDSSSDNTPALASTLIKSAPYLISQRILLRISSTPFTMPESCSNRGWGVARHRARRPQLLDALTLDQDGLVGEDRARASIDQAARLDEYGLRGGGGGRSLGRKPHSDGQRDRHRREQNAPGHEDLRSRSGGNDDQGSTAAWRCVTAFTTRCANTSAPAGPMRVASPFSS